LKHSRDAGSGQKTAIATVTLCEFGKLTAVRINAPDGAEAIVTLFGAHLVSWKSADGRQRLFCSTRSSLDGVRAIRGGMPVIFPQFGERGNGLRHGFARICQWRMTDGGQDGDDSFAQFCLDANDLPPQLALDWPFQFALDLRIGLHADTLNVCLTVRNTGLDPFPFSAALHTYYLIDRLDQASITGLQQGRLADQDQIMALQEPAALRFDGKLDRIYFQVPGPLVLHSAAHTARLELAGFTDVVVWNPGPFDAALLADLGDQEYRHFICMEPALIEPAVLAAGAQWRARQRIRCATVAPGVD
jgi:glucose-6-phosphate 1-epimerase